MTARPAGMSASLARRAAAAGRPLIGPGAARWIARTPLARPLRSLLSTPVGEGPRIHTICGGPLRGMRMSIDLSREKYYWLGTHEPHVARAFAAAIAPGDTVYDIGAHAGYFTLLAALRAGPRGRVVALEAFEPNLHRLRATAAANHLATIDARGAAVSDTCGEARLAIHDSSLEGMLLDDGAPLPPSHDIARTVAATTIDALVAGGTPPPAVIKIDVEGAEGRVIAGARETIAAHRPALLIEVHSPEAACAVAGALPLPYLFENIEDHSMVTRALTPGHFLGRAR